MSELGEDRVYAGGSADATLLVACTSGLLWVDVSGDRVGRFGLARRCDARDVSATGARLILATGSGVLVGPDPSSIDETDLGPASAVGLGDCASFVGSDDGHLRKIEDDRISDLGQVGTVSAIDPPLVGTANGVRTLDRLGQADLSDVRDVCGGANHRVATGSGLYRREDGWVRERAGVATAIAEGQSGLTVAVLDGTLGYLGEDGWVSTDSPTDASLADVAVGPAIYAVTTDGTLLVDVGDGWRHRALGVSGVRSLAVRDRSP
jgi:hypothetical protein